jgi:hypothetical protein
VPFERGAIPSPRHKLAAALPFAPSAEIPPQWARIPQQLSRWNNSRYGDCVTAEEAFAKIADPPNIFITEDEVVRWAGQHGYLNGAMLTDVMDDMIKSGLRANNRTYEDGHYYSVDWTNRAKLCAAIYEGTVKIAVAANQLEGSGAGNHNGWFGHNWHVDHHTDHCVALTGYGPVGKLFSALGVPLPAGANADEFAYLLFTWGTIGVVTEQSMVNVTDEAWIRRPTTAGVDPPPPVPPVPPVPPTPPVPPKPGLWSVIMKVLIADFLARKSWQQIAADIELAVIQWFTQRQREGL